MNRRRLLGAAAGSLLVGPLAGVAQQPAKLARVGVIGAGSASDPFIVAFRQGLRDLGYVENQMSSSIFAAPKGRSNACPNSRAS